MRKYRPRNDWWFYEVITVILGILCLLGILGTLGAGILLGFEATFFLLVAVALFGGGYLICAVIFIFILFVKNRRVI